MRKSTQPPWKRPNPGKTRSKKKLTPQQIAAARARALQAGRRYPNLVDNMWAAKLKPETLARLQGSPEVLAPFVPGHDP